MQRKQPNINFGVAILFVLFCLLFLIILFRFISIQTTGEVLGIDLAARAQSLYQKEKVIEAKRGTIYTRKGDVIAEDTYSYKLVAILNKKVTSNKKKPRHVVDPELTAKKLAKLIDLEESEIYRILTKKTKKGVPFQVEFGKAGRDISLQTKKDIEELKLPGVTFIQDSKRFYPNGIFASHLVGYVEKMEADESKTDTIGMLGIEKSFNDALTGQNGSFRYESDVWGDLLPKGKGLVKPAKNGQDIYLTIDKKIQTFLEDSLNKVDKKYKPEKIIAIVADPKTGEILGMAQRPSFHPKTKEGINESWHNEAIENSFEPGSTMKIFTLASAIEEGVFDPNGSFQSGSYKVTENSSPVKDHNGGRGWGTISYLEGVQRSSNVAFAKIVKEQLGYEVFKEYLSKFGFNQPTGIDLPNETSGKILYEWPLEKVTTGFGQGSAFTPIQQIQAATAVANGGNMMQPYVISKIIDNNKNEIVKKSKPKVVGNPISADTAKRTLDILGTVVTAEEGTGYNRYNIEGYEVAGKTGTAQIPDPETGRYLKGHKNYIFSFLGMAPKDDPELIIYVAVQQPNIDLNTNGAEPVSEIFKPVMKSSLQYLNIEPSQKKKTQSSKTPDVTGMSVNDAKRRLEEKGFKPIVIGEGKKITTQVPDSTFNMLKGERVIIKGDGKLNFPDMAKWSLRDVLKVTKAANLKINTVGNGYVVKQNIKPGSNFTEGDYLIVELNNLSAPVNQEIQKDEVLD